MISSGFYLEAILYYNFRVRYDINHQGYDINHKTHPCLSKHAEIQNKIAKQKNNHLTINSQRITIFL